MFECTFDFSTVAHTSVSVPVVTPVSTIDFLGRLHKKAAKEAENASVLCYRNEELLQKKTLVDDVIILDRIGEVICDTLTADVLVVMDVASLSIKKLNVKYLFVGQTHEVRILKGSVYLGFIQCKDLSLGNIGVTKELRLYADSAEYAASFAGNGTVWSFVSSMTRTADLVMDKQHVFWTRHPSAALLDAAKTDFTIQKELYKQMVTLNQRTPLPFDGIEKKDMKAVASTICSCNTLLSMTGGSQYVMAEIPASRIVKQMETEERLATWFSDKRRTYPDSMLKEGCVPTDHIRTTKTQPVYATTIYGDSTPPQQAGCTAFSAPNSTTVQAPQTFIPQAVYTTPPVMTSPTLMQAPTMEMVEPIVQHIPMEVIQPIQTSRHHVVTPSQQVTVITPPVDIYSPDALMLNGERKPQFVEEMLEGTRKEKEAQQQAAAAKQQQSKSEKGQNK